jgi:ribonuclease HI
MPTISPETTYACLTRLDETNPAQTAAERQVENARCRQQAIEVLADHDVSLQWREAIADRLNAADVMLGMAVVGRNDDSY